ncbi:hypothetical protein ACFZB9_15860 [Kitasatospora sp. NPDC008050]|uniref:hypothetical protein n=1 Tax=Kitasatospora sp. NPDC008050 TaxID=3364021 RepID=UPI0036E80AC7
MVDTAEEWLSPGLPELTKAQREKLAQVGFDVQRLYELSRSKYGVSQVRSALRCFTDACPGEQPTVADVARVGEAWRLASTRPATILRRELTRHGLNHLDPDAGHARSALGEYTPLSKKEREQKPKPPRPRTPGRAVAGWAVVLLLVVVQALLGILDLGIGMVIGGIGLIVGWFLAVRRLVYGRRNPPRPVKVTYILGAIALCYATASTGAVAVMALGSHGVAHIAYEETDTGSHNTKYKQCYVDLPDSYTEPLRTTGSCPAPDGSPVDVYYQPGGDSPLRPVLANSASLDRAGLVWGLPAALGLGLLGYAAAASTRGVERAPRTERVPEQRARPQDRRH